MINSLYSIIYSLLLKAIPITIGGMAVVFLSVKEYGEFSLFLLYITTLSLFSTLGLGTSNNIIFSNKVNTKEYKTFFFKKSLYYWLFSYFIVSCFFLAYSFLYKINYLGMYLLSFGVISFSFLLEGVLYGLKRYKNLVYISSLGFILSVVLYYFIGRQGVYYSIVSYSLARFVMLIGYILFIKATFEFDNKISFANIDQNQIYFNKFKKDFKNITIPFFLTTLCSGPVFAINFIYLEKVLGVEYFAYLNWSYQLYLITTFLPVAVTPLLISKFSNSQNYTSIFKILGVVLFFQTFIILFFIIFLDNILLFAGDIYVKNSKMSALIFLVCTFLFSLNSVFMSFWPAVGKGKIQLLSQILFIVALSLINYFLIPILDSIAFPISMLCAFFFQLLYQLYFIFKVFYANE